MHQPDLFPGVTQAFRLVHGDALESLRALDDQSVDSIVTDPPYGLGKEPDALAMLRDWLDTGHHEVKGKETISRKDRFTRTTKALQRPGSSTAPRRRSPSVEAASTRRSSRWP